MLPEGAGNTTVVFCRTLKKVFISFDIDGVPQYFTTYKYILCELAYIRALANMLTGWAIAHPVDGIVHPLTGISWILPN